MRLLAAIALCAVLVLSACKSNVPVTVQQKASHWVTFYSKDGEVISTCTATAIGPNAILTAKHCNESDEGTQVSFDVATQTYGISAEATDGRDHAIYLIEGVNFSNIAPVNPRPARIGEHVRLYGIGGRTYPPRLREGYVFDAEDPSDVDAAHGLESYHMEVIPGDSGSAVYGDDDSIVGLLSLQMTPDDAAGFALNFTPAQIAKAQIFPKE